MNLYVIKTEIVLRKIVMHVFIRSLNFFFLLQEFFNAQAIVAEFTYRNIGRFVAHCCVNMQLCCGNDRFWCGFYRFFLILCREGDNLNRIS